MRLNRRQLATTQKTMRLWASRLPDSEASELERAFGTLYPHMLIEDVSLGVMPVGGRSWREDFVVSWEPSDPGIERIIREGLAPEYSRDLADAVSDFLREVSQGIMAFGDALYELVFYSEKSGSPPIAYELVYIMPETLRKKGSGFIQIVPSEEAKRRDLPERIELDTNDVLSFSLPPGVRNHKGGLLVMKDVSEHPGPEFLMKNSGRELPSVPYDFNMHHRNTNIMIARITRDLGWSARGLLDRDMLEYYSTYRFLRFEQFKIRLRDHMLGMLNEGLQRVGRRMGFAGSLAVRGLPTHEDIDRAFAKLKSGPTSFKDVIRPFLRT